VRFEISYNKFNRIMMGLMGMGPKRASVVLDDEHLSVRMSWGFSATIPRDAIAGAERNTERVLGWGVHGWRGQWLVNGSSQGIVALRIDPMQRARVIGFRVKLRVLHISLTDPDGFLAALSPVSQP
jgi:hypothetical protein